MTHEEKRLAALEATRKWRVDNREKHRTSSKQWALENKAKKRASNLAYQKRNRQKINAKAVERYAVSPEKALIRTKKWRANSPEGSRVIVRRRRAKLRNAGGFHTAVEIAQMLKEQHGKCANEFCRRDIACHYHADHIMPLALGGDDWIENIQLLCPDCNRKKGALHPDIWIAKIEAEHGYRN